MSESVRVDPKAVRSSLLITPIIAASLLLLPIYVGGLITDYKFTVQQALAIVSFEMWGMAFSMFPAIILMRKMAWKNVVYCALGLMILAFITPSISNLTYSQLAMVRFLGGVGAGTAMAVIMATIGRAPMPDRAFSLWVLSQVAFKVIGIYVIARLLARFGMSGFFVPLLLLCVIALGVVKDLPGKILESTQSGKRIKWSLQSILSLIGVFIFYVSISAIWANFEIFGTNAGLDKASIATIISITSLASFGGAFTATLLAGRIKRQNLLVFGLVLLIISTIALGFILSTSVYTLIGVAFAFAWFFSVPFVVASVNANDETGQLMVFTNSAIAFGLAMGPALAVVFIKYVGFDSLHLIISAVFLMALLFLLVRLPWGSKIVSS